MINFIIALIIAIDPVTSEAIGWSENIFFGVVVSSRLASEEKWPACSYKIDGLDGDFLSAPLNDGKCLRPNQKVKVIISTAREFQEVFTKVEPAP